MKSCRRPSRVLYVALLLVLLVSIGTNFILLTGSCINSSIAPAVPAINEPRYHPVKFKSRRHVNMFVNEFQADVEARLQQLIAANASATDVEVIELTREFIDPPPGKLALLRQSSSSILKTPQAEKIDTVTSQMYGGFFVECGAFDGERASNTIWLELFRNWTGLLVEIDPFFYTQLLGKNRRVWSANVCLSPTRSLGKMPYKPSSRQTGRLQVGFNPDHDQHQRPYAPCIPIESLLLAINKTRIDYFSLDVEGFELEVLQTVPWEKLDIRVVSVEYVHVPYGRQALVDYMRSKGYQMEAELNSIDLPNQVFVNDFIFVRP